MSRLKFKHVFATLLALSAISAFLLPARLAAKVQPQIQSLFYPVARPVRSIAGWFDGRIAPATAKDGRAAQALLEENESLKQDVIVLSQALEEVQRRSGEREKIGLVREYCTPITVVGADAGGREGLLLRGSTLDGLKQGQFALYSGGVAGLIERAPGLAGAEVRLVTDRSFRVGGAFMQYVSDAAGKTHPTRLATPAVIVEGIGDGAMHCATSLTLAEINEAKLKVGDWVIVEDNEWNPRLQNYPLGKVTHIAPQASAPLYADIRIEPSTNLMRLREVMVMTK